MTWADYAPDALAGWAQRSGVGGVCIEHFLLHRELVACLRAHGLSVCTGTINDASLAAGAASLGVDAITSDCPSDLRSRMVARAVAA